MPVQRLTDKLATLQVTFPTGTSTSAVNAFADTIQNSPNTVLPASTYGTVTVSNLQTTGTTPSKCHLCMA